MTDFSPLDSALYESTPEKIAASLRYLRKADAVMAALMPLSASTQAPPAAVPAGYVPVSMLVEAREQVESWGAYAEPYFTGKWDLAGTLAKMDAQIAAALASNKEPSTPRFADQGDGTVIDNATRLQWSKATLTRVRISQREALKLCEGLSLGGHADWRLPTRAELLTLVDDTRQRPAINVEAFPDTKGDWYWTSTVCAGSSTLAWFVDFNNGLCLNGALRGYSLGLVRAVRSMPAIDKSKATLTPKCISQHEDRERILLDRIGKLERLWHDAEVEAVSASAAAMSHAERIFKLEDRIAFIEAERDSMTGVLRARIAELEVAIRNVLRDYAAVHGIGDLEMQPSLFQASQAIDKARKP